MYMYVFAKETAYEGRGRVDKRPFCDNFLPATKITIIWKLTDCSIFFIYHELVHL